MPARQKTKGAKTTRRKSTPRKKRGIKTVSLNFADRMTAADLLPGETSFATQKLVGKVREDLGLSEAELKRIGWKTVTCPECGLPKKGGSAFDPALAEKLRDKKVDFSGLGFKLIVEKLEQLDKDEKVKAAHVPLFKKFDVRPGEDGG